MKKLFLLLILAVGVQISAQAQDKVKDVKSTFTVDLQNDIQFKTAVLNESAELTTQLTNLFGKNFNIASSDVVSQLQKNIANQNASHAMRRTSLMVLYGKKASEYAHLIGR